MADWDTATTSEQETLNLGMLIGRLIEQPTLILLQGDLGAGKTVLARGIARGLGVSEQTPITSPTFTLMNHYPARLDLYHFDLYRLSDPDELIELGFDEFAHGSGVSLVEWPERLNDRGFDRLCVELEYAGEGLRRVRFTARGIDYQKFLRRLKSEFN
ncbi:MAG TPA: tRNA (adenosine(37)-N6)-threonylcarbamoyltransferase complex ATPase subunit type 1 TsaE [Geopsychrobacteraceae bacterium]|nr:tRNA (adenosine(37)-N6)-threonylcarbamoyltransferase complex ATPase subunit type 1 TsaE [Geopsychrobacteraceae bacterium]